MSCSVILSLLGVILVPLLGQALTLDNFLKQVKKKHKLYQSIEVSQEAAQDRYAQGDLILSPVLILKGSYLDDKSIQQNIPSFTITHQKVREYSLGFSKKFASGTSVQMSASTTELYIDALSPSLVSNEKAFGGMGISISQSLWKDQFGKATFLRWSREENQKKLEIKVYDLQAKQILIEAELAFWDLIYQEEELRLRQDSLIRAKKIEHWIQGRLANGIGEKSDLLSAQSLVAARELQLLGIQDELTAVRKKIGDMIEESDLFQKNKWETTSEATLKTRRSLMEMIGNHQDLNRSNQLSGWVSGRVIRLDTYLAALEAKAKQVGAQEVDESLLPDLTLEAGYRTNTYQDSAIEVSSNFQNTDKPTSSIGLKLTWMLDGSTKEAIRRTALADALAARLKRDRKILESDSNWSELQRRYLEMTRKIEAAGKVNKLQSEKAKAERDRLNRGRTVTSQVITAEQDAAEAELVLTRLQAEQRKLEAQASLFVVIESLPE